MRWRLPALGMMTGLALSVLAAHAQEPVVITLRNEDISRRPSTFEMQDAYPDRALRQEKEGRAILACVATNDGKLGNCRVMSEEPREWNFGAAALDLAPVFRLKERNAQGQAFAGAWVVLPVEFRLRG